MRGDFGIFQEKERKIKEREKKKRRFEEAWEPCFLAVILFPKNIQTNFTLILPLKELK